MVPAGAGSKGAAPLSASINRQIVIDARAISPVGNRVNHNPEFLFPYQKTVAEPSDVNDPAAQIQNDATQFGSERPNVKNQFTIPIIIGPHPSTVPFSEGPLATSQLKQASPPVALVKEKHPVRLLVADDNLINLRLLETYTRKRKHKLADSAQNACRHRSGTQTAMISLSWVRSNFPFTLPLAFSDAAPVSKLENCMPLMNGFEATRASRKIGHGHGIVHPS